MDNLDRQHDGHKLVPSDGDARWNALNLQSLADGILEGAIHYNNERARPDGQRVYRVEVVFRVPDITRRRERGVSTVPSVMGLERRTNPFIRADVPSNSRPQPKANKVSPQKSRCSA